MKTSVSRRALLAGLLALAAGPSARAQTFIYNGPFSGTGSTANPWSADNWIGGTPTSSATTQLIFPNFNTNVYSANNDLGNPFVLNGVTSQSWSQVAHTVNSAAGNSFQLSGANPFVSVAGPGSFSFATSGGALNLNPTSGATTLGGAGNGTLTTGTAGISGTGGLAINFTGAGGVSLFGTSTFTGGVTLNAGSLGIGSAGALGAAANVLTINGGTVRTTGSQTISNAVVLNGDLVFTAGTLLALNGTVSGAGGVQVFNGTNFSTQNLTFNNALTFAGPLTIQNSVPQANPSSGNLATITLNAAATLGSAQAITVGNNGTLALSGNAAHLLNANSLVLNGGRLSVTGAAGGNFAETFGSVTASGLNTITMNAGATSSTLSFGNLTRQDNATLFFRGSSFGATNVVRFANGLPTVSDPLAPSTTGQYTAIVPFASTNALAANVNAANRVTYDPATGVGSFSPLSTTLAYQAASGETLAAANDYKNVNLTGGATVNDARRVNSLSMTAAGTISGGGTLTVFSGAVMPVQATTNAVAFNGPTLDFGANAGYIHLGGNLAIQGASAITGSGGLVISGLDAPGSAAGNGSGGGYSVQFSNAANPFTGGLFLNGNATLSFTSNAQLGAAGGAITFNGGGLNFNPAPAVSVTVDRPITLGPAGGSITGITGNSIILSGNISGPGALTIGSNAFVNGAPATTLTGNNTFTGPIYIIGSSGGLLRAGSDANLGSLSAPVSFQGGGGTLQFTASATIAKPITFTGGGGGNLDTNGNAVTLASPLTGVTTAGFNKVGAGTLTLAASSPLFAGRVSVNAGTLNLANANALPQVTTLTVNSGGTLAGNGFVGGSVSVVAGGTLAPGNGPGRITIGNTLTLATGAFTAVELGGLAAGTGFDQVVVAGGLSLGGSLNLSVANGFTLALNQKFFILDDTGPGAPTGAFANGTGAGGLLFTDNLGNTYQINYADRDPLDTSSGLFNDVSLTVVGVVPEPSKFAALLAGGAMLGLRFARRRGARPVPRSGAAS